MPTKIEWTRNADGTKGETWNPVTGCSKVSPGCKNCYAERMAKRLAAMGKTGYDKADPFKVTLRPERLDEPLRWRKPRKVFVASMGDLFHPDVPFEFIDKVLWDIIAKCPQHTFQILTKRVKRWAEYETWQKGQMGSITLWPPNAWFGVTGENQEQFDKRVEELWWSGGPAIRFVSIEPMLERITVQRKHWHTLSWIICGAESGPNRRPMPHDWARDLRDQCVAVGVPFFLKQLSENEDGTGKIIKMPALDGMVWNQTP